MDTSVTTPQAVATIIAVDGQAFARDPAGQMRPLQAGDVLLEGDTVVTLPGGQVQLAFVDGQLLTLLPDESFQFSAETSPTTRPDVAEAALPAGEADRIIQALERGENIDDLLESTAAGLDGGNGGVGNDFVRLLRIVEGVDPLSYQFENNTASVDLPLFESGGLPVQILEAADDAPAIVSTITLNAPASVVEGGAIVYSATVDVAPQGSPLVLSLSNGLTLTIAVGAFSGTSAPVPVRADDVLAQGNTPLTVSIVGASGGGYTSLNLGSPATTTVTDNADVTTVSLSADAAVAEGGNIVYTASLTNPADAAVTVTLSNGATITIAAGASTGSVSVAAPTDDAYVDAGSVSTTISSASGGNFESLAINPAAATTTISDTLDVTTVSLTATPSVAEGGSIVYTASLNHAAQTPVSVTLSNGTMITIAAGVASGSVSVAAPADDVYLDSGNISTTITSAAGGNFENLAINPVPAVTHITDTLDATTVSLTATPSVAEGGSIVYTASLTSAAQTPVMVTLSNGTVITIAAGASSGTATAAAPTDDVYLDAGNVSATIASASGGNFENLAINPAPATTAISYTTDTATVTLTASGSVAEGGSILYSASLNSPAGSPVTVTLSNGATINIAAGTSSGTVSVPAPADTVYADAGSVSATLASAVGGDFESLAINPAPAVTSITDTLDTTTLSLTATPSVTEGGSIVYTASLNNPASAAVTVTLSNGAVIGIAAGTSAGSVSVAAPSDDVYVDAGSVSATIASAAGGNFENLAINPAAATTSITDTTDATTVSLTASPSVAEGGNLTYTASLNNVAQTPVSVTLSNGATISIAAGASAGSVSVAAPSDDGYVDAGLVSATIAAAAGGNFESLVIDPAAATTSITDTLDATTVSLTATPSVAEGGSIVYTASLSQAAQMPVTVTLSNGATLTIAAGASSNTVSVLAPTDDVYLDAGSVSAIIASATGGNFESLVIDPAAATTSITDTLDTTTVSLAATPSVAEGGSITYTASLTSVAQSPVSVTLSNGSTITIAAGASTGSVSIAAPSDDVYLDAGSVNATIISASGGNFESLAVNPAAATTAITDTTNSSTVSLTATPTVAEGGTVTYTASLTSAAQTPVIVTLSNGATITIAAGTASASVNMPAPGDDVYVDAGSVSATIASASGGNFESLAINPAAATTSITDTLDTTTVSLTATPSVAEGGSIVYTASLTSAADTAMSVNLANGATISIAAGASTGSVAVAAPTDDVYLDAGSVSTTITSTSGGNFESLLVNNAPAVTTVTDTLDTVTATLTATPSVTEGGSITYTVSLPSAVTGSPVSVTLSNGLTLTIPVGSSTGTATLSASDDVYAGGNAASATISTIAGGTFENLVASTTPASTTITDDADSTTLSLSATPAVTEGGSIVYTASLTSAAGTAMTVNLANGATISIAAGSSTGSVAVAAPGDDVYLDAGSVSTTISSTSGGNFENLLVSSTPAVTTVTDTLNTTTLSLSGDGSISEGESGSYTVSLTHPAQTDVTVTLSYSGTATGGSDYTGTTSVTIPAGSSSASFTISALNDAAVEGTENVTVSLVSASGGNFENLQLAGGAAGSVTTSIIDDDVVNVSLSATPDLTEAGGSIVYTATLTQAPVSAMTVTLSNGATITIAAGSLSGSTSVPLAAADDVYVDPDSVSATIDSISGGGILASFDPSPAVTSITDTLDSTSLSLSATPSATEGGSIVYTASLSAAAQSQVTVTLDNGAVITIAAGTSSGSVSMLAPGDDVYLDAGSVSATIASATGGNFESLVVNPAPATTSITDTLDTTTLSLTASPSMAEGGSIVYTASLTSPAGAAMTVTLSNGAIITIAEGSSTGSVSVAAPTDDVYVDAGSVSTTISSTSGGNFESLLVNSTPAVTTVTDTLDNTTLSLTASPSVTEGGSIVYTASLTSPADAAMAVNLSNGATITIAAGSSMGSVSVAAPTDDVYIDAGNVSTTIASATGGNFENLAVNPAAATTTITDTLDTTTVSLTATASVAEGGSIVYTASLNNPADAPVSVNLSNGAVISIAAGASAGSVSVAAPSDDVYVDAGLVSATIASAAGGNFENLAVNPAAATTAITDTLDTTTVSLTATPSVAEGGSIVYTASLNNAALSQVAVTLSTGETINIAAGSSSGSVSVLAPSDNVYLDAGSVTTTIASATGGDFENLVVSPVAVTTSITDTLDTTTVSLTATPSVAEGGSIIYTASLTSAAGTAMSVNLANGATITIAAGASTGSVVVAAPSDDVYVDAGSISTTISSTSGGNFENVLVNSTPAVTAITDTIDTVTAKLTATPSVTEGGSIVYTASLTSPAGAAMTVTLSNGATISIAAGASAGSVSVAAPTDDVYVDAGSVSTTISSTSGGNFENLVVDPAAATTAISDTLDTTMVNLSADASVAEGGNITYTASLNNPAGAPVTVTLSNGAVIGIAAGASSGSVSIAAPSDDVYLDAGSVSMTIASATGGNFENLTVNTAAATTTITDTLDVTTVSLTATASVAEGGSIVYTASLNNPADTPVTVTLSNGAVISIAAGAASGTVSVAAPSDDVYLDAALVSATIASASGGNFESLAVNPAAATTTITDTLDVTTVSLTATASVTEGGNITYTASLNTPAGAAVTVSLSNGATISIAAGSSTGSVSVAAPIDDVYTDAGSVSAMITGTSGGNFESLVINPAAVTTSITDTLDTTTLSLTSTPSIAEGGSIVYTASLNNVAQSPVTVTLSNGAGITIAAGASSGAVSVAAPSDDVYVDAGSVSATIASATGGNFESLAINLAAATTSISDTLDTTTVSLTATASVAEGGSIIYTASLTSAAQSPVSVTLSNGSVITIAAGASSGSISVAAPTDDVYVDAGSVSVSIDSAMGGNFESLAVDPTAASTSITDTADTSTVSLTASPSVAEGGSIVYTASLTSPAGAAMTVTLSNGATISIAAGASSGSVSIAAPSDDVYLDAGSASVTIASAAGGNFEKLAINPAAATTTITDTIDVTTVSLTATPSIAEGGSIVYTASLTSAAGTAMTVNLANGATISIAAGSSTGSVAVAAPTDDVYVDSGSISTTISSTSGGNFENVLVNNTPAVTTVTDTLDTTTVSLTATPSVAEGGSIIYTASLNNPAGTAVTVTLSNGAVISIAAGTSSGTVSVLAPSDDAYVDAADASATIASTTGGNFENLLLNPAAATTSITDTLDATTLSLTATPSVAEGGSIVYTASLTAPAQSAVAVTLSNGSSITIAAGSSTGSVSVAAPADDVYLDADSISATIASATGGNFESLLLNPAAATTSITDTLDATTLSLTATPSVAEGGSIVYTASLTAPAQSVVTVTLSNGSSISIAAGASSGSVSVAAPTDDVYLDAGSVSATIASASGGNFESLAINSAAATTAITDTIEVTTVSLTATPSVAEGGNLIYTASLTAPAQGAVTVTLSNGSSISIAAGASSGSVSVPAPTDDVYVDAGSVSASIAAASGGNFESLVVVDPAAATTTITDTLDATTLSLTATPSVAEGGSIVYTASLNSTAQTPVTLTLSNGATISIAAGASSGSVSVAAPSDDVYLDADNVSATISSASGGNFESLAINPAPATTSITDTLDTTTLSISGDGSVAEGASASYTVSLTSPAQSAVTVNLSYSGTAANGADFTGVVSVTIPAGASSASFSLATIDDALAEGAESLTVGIASATGGNFETLAISGANGSVSTSLVDNDATSVSLSATPSLSEAGGTIVYTASASQAPLSDLTLTLSNGASITILAGQTTGSTSVAVAPSDDVYLDPYSLSASISTATGGGVVVVIDPTPAITAVADTLDVTTLSLTATPNVAEGGSITYTASLNNTAQTPVTLTLSNGATINIAAGASSGAVSVVAPGDDVYVDAGNVSATIASAAGGNFESLAINPAAATTAISDTLDVTTVSLTATPSVAEGGNITYTASLNNPAGTPVSVTLSNGATLTIAAGASTGSVSVAAPSDDVYLDSGSVSTTIASPTGGNFESLAINPAPATTNIADTLDTTTVSLTATPSVAEGGNITYTVSLNNVAQTPVSVTLSNGATITIAAGASTGSISVAAPSDDVYVDGGSISTTIASASGGNFENLAINPAPAVTSITDTIDVTTLSLTASASVAEGGSIVYTASLNNLAATPISVTLSNGAVITIAAGASSNSVSVPAPADDAYVDAGTISATISAAAGGNFESLTINPTAATTSISDTLDTTTLDLTASASVVEGGTVTYTASVGQPVTGSPLTVSLSNGLSISIPVGASSASVSMAAPDDVYTGGASLAVTVTGTSGANYENLSIGTGAAGSPVVTAVTDDADPTTVSLSASASVAEGGNIVYTASLSSAAEAPVSVTLSNGATISIAAGASTGSISLAAPSDDVYLDAGSIGATIASATGGNFENLAINPAAATTAITDTPDTTTVSLTASASVTEGSNLTYTASLNNAAQTPVNVTLSNGATITIAAGASSGTVSVAAPGDDVYVDAGNVSATISAATGGNFESLAINPAAAVTSITDTLDTTTVSLSADASVAEGGNITYTASLNNVAQAPVNVTLSNGATITIAAGTATGTVSVAAPSDDVYVDAGSVSATIASAAGGNFENLAINPAAATTTISDTLNSTTISLSADASVAEGGNITYIASLNNVAQTPVSVTLSNGATITIAAGASSGTVSVAAPADDVYVDAGSISASITTASGGSFENLVINPLAATTAITDTLDATTVSLSADASVAEGGSIIYTASLSSAAQTPVSVTLSNGAVISIAAGASTGSISVAAPSDDVYSDAGSVSAAIATATGGNFESLAINPAAATTHITDTLDLTSVSLTATPSVAEGGNIVYTASLNNLAGTPVSVTLSNGATITIAAGASTGTVSVAAPSDDVYVDAGSVSATITSASGGNFESLAVNPAAATTSITDTLNTTTVSITGDVNVNEGTSASYTVSLTNPAQSAVTVNLSYSGTAANGADFSGVLSVTVPAGASSASFSIAMIDDALVETAENLVVSIASATGGNFENLAVSGAASSVSTSISDNDTTTLSVSSPTVLENSGYAQFTVSLSNASSQSTTVNLSLTNGSAGAADFGPGLEVSTDGGMTWLAATSATIPANQTSILVRTPITSDTLDEASETFSLTATHLSGTPVTNPGGTATGTATITDDDATPSLSIDNVTLNEGAGTATFTVTLNAASGQTVTVNYGTSNGTALSGTGNDYTTTSGTLTFNPGTTSQTITVSVLNDAVYEGAEAFNVTLSGATNATIGTATGVGTILDNGTGAGGTDNDVPTLSVSSPSVAETGGYAQFTVSLSNPSTSPVVFTPSLTSGTATLGTDTTAASTLEVSTDNGASWSSVSGNVSIAAGSTSVLLRLAVTDDATVEGAENFTLNATVVGGGTVNGSAFGTATITDNDAIVVSSTTSDDDDVNENRDAIAGNNIVHTGVISNVAPTVTLSISDSGASGLTSNGEAITYSWNSASRTMTATSASGTVFTVTLSAANDGYTFTQLRGIDHAVLAGETQSLNIPLTLMALDTNGAPFTSSVFNVTVYDDAPSVTGSKVIVTENDGSYSGSGYLTEATLSNDITGVSWNTAGMPALVFEGKPVLYVDHGNGTLTGELTDGTLIFRATINPTIVDASNHPQYSFELLNTLGRLGIEAAENSYTVISGGNISNLDLGFGGYLVDSMIAVDGSGDPISINTNNNWIGLGGNWFNPGEALFMSFTDVSGNAGQVRGMNLLVEGQGSAPYTLNWSVTAAIDYSGNTITYSGSVSGVGNTDVPFSIPLSGGALYFTDIQVSAPAGSGEFRIALSGIATNDYFSDIPLALDYTLTDADGDTASGLIDVTLMSGNAAPFIGTSAASATVSEEGLINGLMDAVGTPTDSTNATVMTGSMAISDPDGTTPTVTLDWSGTAPALTSGGVAVTWTGAGTNTLVGSTGGAEVVRVAMTDNGSYTVTLSKAIDHVTTNAEDVFAFNVQVSATDGEKTTTGTLTVNIEDDSATVGNLTQAVMVPQQDTNLMIILDVSGSMDDASGIIGQTRLQAAKNAINQLIDSYDSLGDVKVRVVSFSTGASWSGSMWADAATGKTQINALVTDLWTNYDAALADAMTAFGHSGKIVGAQNVSYFLSDGAPTYSNNNINTLSDTNGTRNNNSDEGIQAAEEVIWTNFLNSNDIKSYALGIGTGLTPDAQTDLNPIAYDGTGAGINTNATLVTNMSQLSSVLQGTVPPATAGNLLSGNVAFGSGSGADGGYMPALTLDGSTYTYDSGTGAITVSGSGGSGYTYDATTHELSLSTAKGGILKVDMDDGQYSYTPSGTMSGTVTEVIGFSLTDADGDTSTGLLTLNVSREGSTITGTSGANTLNSTSGADILIGGAGNDTLSGLVGGDTFTWNLADRGTPASPARDTVTDFDLAINSDKLDLRDLLQGELHAGTDVGNLADYLHFSYNSTTSTTVLEVKSQGAAMSGPDQVINLSSVDLVAGFTSDQQIIQDLLSKGKLITD